MSGRRKRVVSRHHHVTAGQVLPPTAISKASMVKDNAENGLGCWSKTALDNAAFEEAKDDSHSWVQVMEEAFFLSLVLKSSCRGARSFANRGINLR